MLTYLVKYLNPEIDEGVIGPHKSVPTTWFGRLALYLGSISREADCFLDLTCGHKSQSGSGGMCANRLWAIELIPDSSPTPDLSSPAVPDFLETGLGKLPKSLLISYVSLTQKSPSFPQCIGTKSRFSPVLTCGKYNFVLSSLIRQPSFSNFRSDNNR